MRKALLSTVVAVIPAFLLSAALPVQAQNANARGVCLNTTQLMSTQATNSRTIIFRMKDGSVWRNDLARPCPDLVGHRGGLSQLVHVDTICANVQEFEVSATGMVCRLGEFTQVSAPTSSR